MANVAWGKKILAVAVLSCLCASIAVPAYAFYYVHGEENVAATSKGVIEVTCTVDETAQGGGVKTSLIIVPEGSTAAGLPGRERGFQQQSERPCGHSRLQRLQLGGRAVRQAVHVHGAQGRQPEAGHAHRVRRKRHRGREHAARALRQRGVHGGVIRRAGVRTTSGPRTPPVPARQAPRYSSQAGPMQHRDASARPRKQTGALPNIILRGLFFYYPRSNGLAHRAQNPDRLAHLARKNNLCTV